MLKVNATRWHLQWLRCHLVLSPSGIMLQYGKNQILVQKELMCSCQEPQFLSSPIQRSSVRQSSRDYSGVVVLLEAGVPIWWASQELPWHQTGLKQQIGEDANWTNSDPLCYSPLLIDFLPQTVSKLGQTYLALGCLPVWRWYMLLFLNQLKIQKPVPWWEDAKICMQAKFSSLNKSGCL